MKAATVVERKKITNLPGARGGMFWRKRLFVGFLLALVLYFALLFATQYWRQVQFGQALEEIEAEVESVRLANEEMQAEIERLHSPAYLEEVARQELGMVRSGELLFFFQDSDNLQ